MIFSGFAVLLMAGLADLSKGSQVPLGRLHANPETALVVRRDGTHLQKRVEASVSLEKSFDGQVLFDGNSNILGEVGAPPVTVVCTRCCTSGEIVASLDNDEVIDPTFRLDLRGLSASIELDVLAMGEATFTIPLLASPGKLVSSVLRGFEAGLDFGLDLVFTFSGALNAKGGFVIDFPDNAFFEVSVFDGAMTDFSFDGIKTMALPFSINLNGTPTFQVDLQLQANLGLNATDVVPFIDIGAGIGVGAFANLFEYVAELQTTPQCQLQTSESANVNLGVFGGANLEIGNFVAGAVPTVSTKLFEVDLGTKCLIPNGLPIPTKEPPTVTTPTCQVTPPPGGNGTTGNYTSPARMRRGMLPPMPSIPPQAPPLGVETVLTITQCKTALVNCPEEAIQTFEVPTTICPPAMATPTVCVAGNNTGGFVPVMPLPTPITASMGLPPPVANITAPPGGSNMTMQVPPAATPSQSKSKIIVVIVHHSTAAEGVAAPTGTPPAVFVPVPGTGASPSGILPPPPQNESGFSNTSRPLVVVSGGQHNPQYKWDLCSVALIGLASIFWFTL